MQDPRLTELLQLVYSSHWGLLALALLMTLEAMPVVGFFIPGVFLMVGLGSLAHVGRLPFGELVLAASVGAILGDSIGFWLGHLGFADKAWGASHRRVVEGRRMAAELLQRRGRLAVFIGRFVWFFHPAVPVIAGVTGIRPGWFYLADIPAAVLWVSIYGGVGYLATGMLRERALEVLAALGIIAAGALIYFLYRYLRRRRG